MQQRPPLPACLLTAFQDPSSMRQELHFTGAMLTFQADSVYACAQCSYKLILLPFQKWTYVKLDNCRVRR